MLMHVILVKLSLYVSEKDKKTQSSPFRFLSSEIFQNPARFSNFGINSPDWLVDLLFWI